MSKDRIEYLTRLVEVQTRELDRRAYTISELYKEIRDLREEVLIWKTKFKEE